MSGDDSPHGAQSYPSESSHSQENHHQQQQNVQQHLQHPSSAYHNVPLKRSRSTRACDTCRRKRTKCTGGQPCEGCFAFSLACTYTAPVRKRGPVKRPPPPPVAKVQTTLGQRLRTVESLLSGLIHGAPASPGSSHGEPGPTGRPRASSESSVISGSRLPASSIQVTDDEEDGYEYESDDGSMECDEPSEGFHGIALAIHRPRERKLDAARATSVDAEPAPTFCQVPWRQGVTVTDPESGVLVQQLSLNDPSVIAHRFNNNAGNITIVEDVVSDTVLFYGSTSTSNTSALRQSPRFNDGIMSIALRSDVLPANPTISHDSPPCSPDLVHHLVSVYFTHIHPYFPMIDHKSFTRQLKEKQTEHFSLLLNSMCALVTQQTRSLSAWGISSTAELHRAFFERARALLGKQFDWPHINNVQAMLLLTLVGAGTNTNAASYQYIGIAHRHAVELGMHRNLEKLNHPGLDNAMKEQMRATWFCLYILDRYTGVHQGRPFAINDDDWDTPLPRQEETGDVARMIRHVALCSILGQIANYVNRPSGRRKSRTSRDQWVREIDEELSAWRSLLPHDLQQEPSRKAGSWSFHHHLHVMYYTAVILLYRIATGRFGGLCVSSAVAIQEVLEALPLSPSIVSPSAGMDGSNTALGVRDYVFVMPIVVYSGLTASTMFLDMVLESHLGPDHHRQQQNRRKRSKSGEGGVKPESPSEQRPLVDAASELRRSLLAFEKLKDISQFSVYYGQLIAECMKGAGMMAGEAAGGAGMPRIENIVLKAKPIITLHPAATTSGPDGPPMQQEPQSYGQSLPFGNVRQDYGCPVTPSSQSHPQGGASLDDQQQRQSGQEHTYIPQPFMNSFPPLNQTMNSAHIFSGTDLNQVPQQQQQQGININPYASTGAIFPPASVQPNPYFGDSIFSELLNPFFDPAATWWGDFGGLDAAGSASTGGSSSGGQQQQPQAQPRPQHPNGAGQQ
ncbi:hypothetical protein HKX48_000265 [Thoreauomyces humboldtii]|nr:hypothetical protein HKX48_000265 [Thoreauomyces humboldtii]